MKNVLVVDDNDSVLEFMTDLLEYQGCSVLTAGSGEDAIKIARERKIDIAFIDICLPGIDGVETLRRLKTDHPNTVFILISGVTAEETLDEAFKLGASRFLKKPFTIEDVIESLDLTGP